MVLLLVEGLSWKLKMILEFFCWEPPLQILKFFIEILSKIHQICTREVTTKKLTLLKLKLLTSTNFLVAHSNRAVMQQKNQDTTAVTTTNEIEAWLVN